MLNFDDYKNPRVLIVASIVITILVSQILLDLGQIINLKEWIIIGVENSIIGYLLFIPLYAFILIIITLGSLIIVDKLIADLINP